MAMDRLKYVITFGMMCLLGIKNGTVALVMVY
jgi:hypothetical protein